MHDGLARHAAGFADAGQIGQSDPAGRVVRAEVGRVPVDLFRDGDEVEFGSRNERPMTRYFPELVAAAIAELPQRCVIDGEIVIATDHGLDFEALQQRIHPADSRVRMLAEKTPASFIAFDLLALGDDDYTGRPFTERRAALVDALAGSGPAFHVTPATTDLDVRAAVVRRVRGRGPRRRDRQTAVDHLPAGQAHHVQDQARAHRRLRGRRLPGAQVRRRRDRLAAARAVPDDGTLASVGVIGAFPMAKRRELFTELQPLVTDFDGHPWNWAAHEAGERTPRKNEFSRWNAGKDLSFVPLRPERVVEVRYDHMEGAAVPPHRAVQPLAARPRAVVVHLRATRQPRHVQPRRHRARPRREREDWLLL